MEFVRRNEVMEAAKELGEALRDSDECRKVEAAFEALSLDEEANRILSETQSQDNSDSNPVIRNHVQAQEKLQILLDKLNAEISNILGINFAAASRQKKSGCH